MDCLIYTRLSLEIVSIYYYKLNFCKYVFIYLYTLNDVSYINSCLWNSQNIAHEIK